MRTKSGNSKETEIRQRQKRKQNEMGRNNKPAGGCGIAAEENTITKQKKLTKSEDNIHKENEARKLE